jgi:hypothetical protein
MVWVLRVGLSPDGLGIPPRNAKACTGASEGAQGSGLAPADIGKIIGASRATVYRYLSLGITEGA